MKEIILTPANLLLYLGLKKIEDISGASLAKFMIDGAVLSTGNESFVIQEATIMSTCLTFSGINKRVTIWLDTNTISHCTLYIK